MTVRELLALNNLTVHGSMSPRQLVAAYNRLPPKIKALLPAAVGAGVAALATAIAIEDNTAKVLTTSRQVYESARDLINTRTAATQGDTAYVSAQVAKTASDQLHQQFEAQLVSAANSASNAILNTQIPGT